MRKKLVIMITCMLFLILCFSGCEQLFKKPDHIKVNVMVAVFINVVDENYKPINISLDGAEATIELFKNGEEHVVLRRTVQNCLCQATYEYTFTQGQSIECFATVLNLYNNCHLVTNGSSMLTWETASASVSLSGLYNWYPHITLIMMHDSAK